MKVGDFASYKSTGNVPWKKEKIVKISVYKGTKIIEFSNGDICQMEECYPIKNKKKGWGHSITKPGWEGVHFYIETEKPNEAISLCGERERQDDIAWLKSYENHRYQLHCCICDKIYTKKYTTKINPGMTGNPAMEGKNDRKT